MFTISGATDRKSGGIQSRDFLQVGSLGLGGLGLADVLKSQARGDVAKPRQCKSLIYVVLEGGPSHIDTWDPKPRSPDEIRGLFRPISTRLTGVQICELM